MRIVSLVPSLTELLWWLGAGNKLVGRTAFCTEPATIATTVPALGGTKTPDIDAICALAPELVLANREENRREDVEELERRGVRVLVTEINSMAQALAVIRQLGGLLGAEYRANKLAAEVEAAVAEPSPEPAPKVFVAVWGRPLMGLGGETFGHAMLAAAGAVNVLGGRPRYPLVSLEEVAREAPDLVLLPDEPYRFAERYVPRFAAVAPTRIIDGKLLWWYGPRIPASVRTLRTIIATTSRARG